MVSFGSNVVEILIRATDGASAKINAIKGKLAGLGSAVQKLRGPMLAIGAASAAGLGLALKASIDFEKEMANVTTLMGTGGDASATYGDLVHRLGTEFGVSGGKAGVAASLYQVVSAGFMDASDAAIVLEEAVKASIGGSVDASVAITGLTQVLNAYGLEASEAENISDIMFQTVAKGVTTYGELGSALSTVLPTANALGVNFETVSAALATLTQQGLSASESTVALNMMMLAFLKPSEEMSLALNEIAAEQGLLSVEVQNATSDYITQQAELNNLSAAYTETTEEIAGMSAELDDMGDAMAVNRVKIQEIRLTARKEGRELTEGELEDIDKIKLSNEELSLSYNKLRITQDDLQETQVEQKNSIDAQKKSLEASGEVLKDVSEKTGENLLKTLDFATVLGLLSEKADGSTTKMAKFFNQIRGLKGALGLTGDNAENFSEKIEDMANAQGVAGEATETMSETMSIKLQEVMNNFGALAIKIGDKLVPVLEKMLPVVEKVIDFLDKLNPAIIPVTMILGTLVGVFALLLPAISAAASLIGGAGGLSAVIGLLTGPIGWVILAVGLLAAAWATDFGGIQGIVGAVVEAVFPLLQRVADILMRLVTVVLDFLVPAFLFLLEAVEPIFVALWENVFSPTLDLIVGGLTGIIDVFDAIVSALEGDMKPLQKVLDNIALGFTQFFTGIVDAAFSFGADLVNSIVEGIKSIGSLIADTLWGLIPKEIRQFIGAGVEAVSSGFETIASGVSSIIEPVDDLIISGNRVFKTAPDDTIAAFKGDSPFGIGGNPSIEKVEVHLHNPVFTNDLSFEENGAKIGQETVRQYRRLKR